ncbi:hypothetical protein [Amycolatopsis pigmentata]|uniref:Uncharacterized protein n=1 Tax=Amycolatopsis pigmentata TaxID=450801 RepID=A0ABW5FWU9_9PSEU
MARPRVTSRVGILAIGGLVTVLAGAGVLPAQATATTQITDLGVLPGGSYS